MLHRVCRLLRDELFYGVVGGRGTHVDGKPLLADHIKEVNREWTSDSR